MEPNAKFHKTLFSKGFACFCVYKYKQWNNFSETEGPYTNLPFKICEDHLIITQSNAFWKKSTYRLSQAFGSTGCMIPEKQLSDLSSAPLNLVLLRLSCKLSFKSMQAIMSYSCLSKFGFASLELSDIWQPYCLQNFNLFLIYWGSNSPEFGTKCHEIGHKS